MYIYSIYLQKTGVDITQYSTRITGKYLLHIKQETGV